MSNIDLHIHTKASDGSDTIPELLEKIQSSGIRTFAVTDHDAISGALAMEQLVPPEIRYIRGIEFSCRSPKGKCHILGYGFDPADPVFRDAMEQGRQLRLANLRRRMEFLAKEFRIFLTDDEIRWLHSLESPGKPHLAEILMARKKASTTKEAIKTYINPCGGGSERIPAATAIRGILHAGGIPVWAHPLGGEGEDRLGEKDFLAQLEELMAEGIRGMECHYSRYTPAEAAYLEKHAAENGLLVSAGSDYHGTRKQNIHLGKLNTESRDVDPRRVTIL